MTDLKEYCAAINKNSALTGAEIDEREPPPIELKPTNYLVKGGYRSTLVSVRKSGTRR